MSKHTRHNVTLKLSNIESRYTFYEKDIKALKFVLFLGGGLKLFQQHYFLLSKNSFKDILSVNVMSIKKFV